MRNAVGAGPFQWRLLLSLSLPGPGFYAAAFLVSAAAALLVGVEPRGRRLEDTVGAGGPVL